MVFTFVTAYFKIYESDKFDFYFEQFKKLVSTGFPIIVFLDDTIDSKLLKFYNVKVISISYKSLPINDYIDNNAELPKNRNIEKDTINFLKLMNSKTYFLRLAKNDINSNGNNSNINTLIWIDFGIMKLCKDIEHFKKNFNILSTDKNLTKKILIPGGKNQKALLTTTEIYWRFLGGIIICPKNLVEKFDDLCNIEIKKLSLTYEVNIYANVEYNNPELIQYHYSDHNDTMFGFYDVRIILLSMIKNEEKIIERCISGCKDLCDAICISDTGSIDNSIEIINNYCNNNKIQYKVYSNPWKNFGHNRTISYQNGCDFCKSLGWNPEYTYGLLLDADMKLVINNFDKNTLNLNGYQIVQSNSAMFYYNTRFVKLNNTWKCVGVTHEYWDNGVNSSYGKVEKQNIYIDDVGDGGSKSDKFTRDLKLLKEGIKEEPKNCRYYFYIAQTYRDLNMYDEAIEYYKIRINLAGWVEEVWHSYYSIAKCYLIKYLETSNQSEKAENLAKAELWVNRAYNYKKDRSEPIIMFVQFLREKGDHHKAIHYYNIGKKIPDNTEDILFIEKSDYKFEYENTILHYYISNDKLSGLKSSINYLNKNYNYNEVLVYNNMDFYITELFNFTMKLEIPNYKNFVPSTSSILIHNNKLLMNVRYVNYEIDALGKYHLRTESNLISTTIPNSNSNSNSNSNFTPIFNSTPVSNSSSNFTTTLTENNKNTFNDTANTDNISIITKNALIYLDNNFSLVTEPLFFSDNFMIDTEPLINCGIIGLEDMRLLHFKDKIYYTATTRNYSDTNSMIIGEYDINTLTYKNSKLINNNGRCEKNWIPLNFNNEEVLYLYNWCPIQIGKIVDNSIKIILSYDTPLFFKFYRGSTTFQLYKDQLWCIVHGVKYTTPRKYYHQFVILDKNTYKPVGYTVPFYFNNFKIEYTVGLLILNDFAFIIFSSNDCNPSLMKVPMGRIMELLM